MVALEKLRKWIRRKRGLLGDSALCWAAYVHWNADFTEIDNEKTVRMIVDNFAITPFLRFPIAFTERDAATVYLWLALTEEQKGHWRARIELLMSISSYINE